MEDVENIEIIGERNERGEKER